MDNYCCICGAWCSGKLQMQVRKNGEPKPFCPICFNEFLDLDLKEIRKRIKQ